MKIKENIFEVIFPSNIYCICCGSIIDKSRPYALCDSCVEKFHWATGKTCKKCGKILEETYKNDYCYDCMDTKHVFRKGYTCSRYGLYERAVMMDYKYNDKSYIGRKLAEIMADRMKKEEIIWDMVIPVPAHPSREKKRGYNQSELLAKYFAEKADIPFDGTILIRNKNTEPMKALDLAERRSNVKNAFCIKKGREKYIIDKEILLVDDIFTTGSTLDSCSLELIRKGASAVDVLTFAAGVNLSTG